MRHLSLWITLSCVGCTSANSLPMGTVDASQPADLAITSEQACAEAAAAYCAAFARCIPIYITAYFADLASCVSRVTLGCRPAFGLKGTSSTPAIYSACAQALPGATCDDLLAGKTPAACPPLPGMLGDGTGCGDDAQCQSSFCARPLGQSCGACGPSPGAGAACDKIACGRGLGCVNKVCVARATAGMPCDDGHPCIASLSCQGAGQGKMGTCAIQVRAGAACDPKTQTTAGCEELSAYYCHPLTRICTPASFAGPGEPCGFVGNGYAGCRASGHCRVPKGAVSGTCIRTAADGAACDDTLGPTCLGPARCAGGVCKIDDPASCM